MDSKGNKIGNRGRPKMKQADSGKLSEGLGFRLEFLHNFFYKDSGVASIDFGTE